MQSHELKRRTPNKKTPKVGRGGRRGKTSGRGHKGQKARTGHSIRPEIRDMIKKIPKKRGYKFNSFREKPQGVNVSLLEEIFNSGDVVNVSALLKKGIVKRNEGKSPKVKILGFGEIEKKLKFTGVLVSKVAKEKIEKVGGSIE